VLQIVKPFDEVAYSLVIFPAAFDRRHNFFHVVLLTLLDVIYLTEYSSGVRWRSVLTCSIRLEERYMEDIVDLPLPRQRETGGERRDDFLNLEGTMIFVVQFSRGSARFDIVSVEHNQISYLVCRRFLSVRVGVSAHSVLCSLQPSSTTPSCTICIQCVYNVLAGFSGFILGGLTTVGWNP